MQPRKFILRFSAFFLILIFSQKTGAGLFVHNLLHAKNANDPSKPENENKNGISYACNCIDDFLTPFTETDEPVCFQNNIKHTIPVVFLKEDIPFRTVIFSSLRGPPASIL